MRREVECVCGHAFMVPESMTGAYCPQCGEFIDLPMEKVAGHTPGPWDAIGDFVEDARGKLVAGTYDNRIANARLIAAAPDMLEALEHLVEFVADPEQGLLRHSSRAAENYSCIRRARAAIAKARAKR